MRGILVALILLTLAGCGHFLTTQDYSIQPYQGITPPQSDTATVVFLWPNRRNGAATLAVQENGAIIGALQGGTYFSQAVTPGQHTFAVDSGLMEKSREQVSLTAISGRTYFISYTSGGFYVVAKLDLVSEDVALAQLPELSMIQFVRR